MNWDMILLFAATMPVSAAMSSEETGVIKFIVELLEPLFTHFSGLTFCIAFIIVAGVLTQIAHNPGLGRAAHAGLVSVLPAAGRQSPAHDRALCLRYRSGYRHTGRISTRRAHLHQ